MIIVLRSIFGSWRSPGGGLDRGCIVMAVWRACGRLLVDELAHGCRVVGADEIEGDSDFEYNGMLELDFCDSILSLGESLHVLDVMSS
jgi:hypothetical protein